jgi:PAS domain S-box-containing protein
VAHSFTDLAGLKLSAEAFFAAVLEKVAQPLWVVDAEGRIRFANPAAVGALGHDSAEELLGRDSHETIRYRHPDRTPGSAADWPMLLPRATGETVASELDWFVRRDGSKFPVSYVSVPIDMPEGRGVVVAFTDAGDRVRGEQWRRQHEAMLAAQRRVATLVAGGAASADVLAAIAKEVGHVTGLPMVAVWRYEPDGATATVIGAWGELPHPFRTGTTWPLDGPTIARVLKTGRPARVDDYAERPGAIAAAARESGMRSVAGAPIIVDGEVWGVMVTASTDRQPLPDQIEDRLAEFTELVATAIANAESRAGLARLAEEQAALRRVATLVAREALQREVFTVIVEEVRRLLGGDYVRMVRFEDDSSGVVVANSGATEDVLPVGSRVPLEGDNAVSRVFRTQRAARIDDYRTASGAIAQSAHEMGIRGGVATPVLVEGRLWGAMAAGTTRSEPLPPETESRLGQFTELMATAIGNTESRQSRPARRGAGRAAPGGDARRQGGAAGGGVREGRRRGGERARRGRLRAVPRQGRQDCERCRFVGRRLVGRLPGGHARTR